MGNIMILKDLQNRSMPAVASGRDTTKRVRRHPACVPTPLQIYVKQVLPLGSATNGRRWKMLVGVQGPWFTVEHLDG
jgi:hypothetical protein